MIRNLRLALASATMLAGVIGCSDRSAGSALTEPPEPLAVGTVNPNPALADAAEISFTRGTADSVRAHYVSSDSSDVGVTPWLPAGQGTLSVVGLRAGTLYNLSLEARRGQTSVLGPGTSYTSPPLPQALAGVSMTLLSGTPPTSGYTLTAISGIAGHGYLLAFDGAGNIRWYHDCGPWDVQEGKQQSNGDLTVYVGNAIGSNAATGSFVEITAAGDSVRSIAAKGSAYTDGHELLVQSDVNGKHVADYLFGYDIRSVDETAEGGSEGQLAGHQLLRISASGAVDTLMQSWGYWTRADRIDPPIADQSIDHPNSIDFDLDGGVIASFRNLGAVVKIDPSTRKVLWQLGGARNQFTFINDPLNGFSGQHSVRVLPNGHFLIFDNGVSNTPGASRAVEYAVDESAKTATMVWQYIPQPSLFNEFTGSVQRLSNGNTVVAWTNYGLIDEVAPSGALVNRMQLTLAGGVPATAAYRAIRIDNLYRYVRP
ncbi:MAG TPA: aryl-sulfate sulfotransferase [Gemmatimonadaceae bacterium]|nr:aryl-sulfate sulfotransferase [Gemmatimonadaceae bacterium]